MKKTINKIITCVFAAFAPEPLFAQYEYSDSSSDLRVAIFAGLIALASFILIRRLVCWYYKINDIVDNQVEIIKLLRAIASKHSDMDASEQKYSRFKKFTVDELICACEGVPLGLAESHLIDLSNELRGVKNDEATKLISFIDAYTTYISKGVRPHGVSDSDFDGFTKITNAFSRV